jgi:hypothetical protein
MAQLPGAAEMAQMPQRVRVNVNPLMLAMVWYIFMGDRNDRMGRNRGRYGGTRRKNKKMSRRRGGARVLNGIINSEESLVKFLNVIAKLNEKNTEPYYVVLSNVERKDVISLFDLLHIDAPIVDARGYEKKMLYEESDDE